MLAHETLLNPELTLVSWPENQAVWFCLARINCLPYVYPPFLSLFLISSLPLILSLLSLPFFLLLHPLILSFSKHLLNALCVLALCWRLRIQRRTNIAPLPQRTYSLLGDSDMGSGNESMICGVL